MENFRILIPSQKKINWIARSAITLAGCALLLIPILLLYFFQTRGDAVKLSIIIATVLAFSVVTSGLTSAKNWEVVAASIAYVFMIGSWVMRPLMLRWLTSSRYAAVLVVFISSGVGGDVSSSVSSHSTNATAPSR